MQSNRMLLAAAVAAAVLIAVSAPVASLLPFALLLACPLTMVLMMRRMSGSHGEDHGGHGSESGSAPKPDTVRADAQPTDTR